MTQKSIFQAREHSEGEIWSDDEQTIAMDTDPAVAAPQRFPEIDDRTEFPEVNRWNRTRRRRKFLTTCKLPKITQDTSIYQDFKKLTAINFSYTHASVMHYSSKLKRQTRKQRVVIPTPVTCGRYFVTGDDGRPRCYAVITLNWGSTIKATVDKRYCQFNPGHFTVWAELADIRTRPVSVTHFIGLGDGLLKGEYRLVQAPVDNK